MGILGNFGSGGNSKKSTTTTTASYSNQDSRAVQGDNGIAVTGNGSGVSIVDNSQSVDPQIALAAFDFAKAANATQGDGFDKLLSVADGLASQGQTLISTTRDAVAQAYGKAYSDVSGMVTEQKGTWDRKTIVLLAGMGALVFAAFALRR